MEEMKLGKAIHDCSDCHFWIMAGNPFFCAKSKRDITEDDLEPFPTWCELENAPVFDDQ